jgi:outer membrane protein OmpA-like peptidoglycan-associated protein
MKNTYKILSLTVVISLFFNCTALQNANKTQKGAGIGVASGALIGGLIGGDLKGALIGAAIGGASGGVIGNVMDKQAKEISAAVPGADVERVGEGIHLIFDENSGVNFATNKSDLTAASKANLDKISKVLNEFADTKISIQGHTDDTGKAEYNLSLSKKRAESVASYLASKGVYRNRLTTEAMGETTPRFDNTTVDGRSKNRRVEMAIVADDQMIKDAQAKSGY